MCVPCYTEQGSETRGYLKPWKDGGKAEEHQLCPVTKGTCAEE